MEVVYPFFLYVLIGTVILAGMIMYLGFHYRHAQSKLLYYPQLPGGQCDSPATFGLTNYEDVHIRTSDGVNLRGFLLRPPSIPGASQKPQPSTPQFALLYFHGNAGNVGHRIPIAALLASQLRCAVLMVDYRGYGNSDPVEPTEDGLKRDASACFEYLWNNTCIPRERIFVMGTSLGGAVAIHLASSAFNSRRIAGLIIENTFTSISDMTDVVAEPVIFHAVSSCPAFAFCVFRYFIKPLALFIGWWSLDHIREIKLPILFLSGLKDELVPAEHMKRLYGAATNATAKRMVEFPSGTHNDLPSMEGYAAAIESFVREIISIRGGAVVQFRS